MHHHKPHSSNHPTNMDSLSYFLGIVGLLASLFWYSFTRRMKWCSKSNSSQPPEPSGSLPIIGHLHLLGSTNRPIARILGSMADKYGPVFSLRLGSSSAVVVSNWESIKECFTTNDRVLATRPKTAFGKYIGYDYASFGLSPYGPYWREVRKMVTLELLTARQLAKFSHVRSEEVNHFVNEIYSQCNGGAQQKLVLDGRFEDVTFNIAMRLFAGKRYSGDGDGDGEFRQLKEGIKRALYLSGVFVVSDAIPWMEWMDIGGHLKSIKTTAKQIDEVLSKWVEEHRNYQRTNKVDSGGDGYCGNYGKGGLMEVMMSTLGVAEEEGSSNMSGLNIDTIVKATVLILITTGSESTAETLIWAMSLLMNNRDVLKRAQDELDIHVGRQRWVEESDINSLTYLQAIIKETLRLYPPGPVAGPREAMEDCYVGGYNVPKGTRLILNLWKLHRDPTTWVDPEEFKPERFLTDYAHVKYKGEQYEYVPFSGGRRMCPGLTYGLQVVHLTLARLLQGFDVAVDDPVDMTEGLGIALPKLIPLEVTISPRLNPELYDHYSGPSNEEV